MVVPYEAQAYQMDARFTKDPKDVFSVEAEVRGWMRDGKYEDLSEVTSRKINRAKA